MLIDDFADQGRSKCTPMDNCYVQMCGRTPWSHIWIVHWTHHTGDTQQLMVSFSWGWMRWTLKIAWKVTWKVTWKARGRLHGRHMEGYMEGYMEGTFKSTAFIFPKFVVCIITKHVLLNHRLGIRQRSDKFKGHSQCSIDKFWWTVNFLQMTDVQSLESSIW